MDPIPSQFEDRLIGLGDSAWAIQLQRSDQQRLLLASCCELGDPVLTSIDGVAGGPVRTSNLNRATGGVWPQRSVDDSKTISMEFALIDCGCNQEPPDPYRITSIFRSTGVEDAVLTWVDGFKQIRRFRGRPLGANVIGQQTSEATQVRAQFLAVDPRGYGPKTIQPLRVTRDVDGGVSSIDETIEVQVYNGGGAPASWWVEKSGGEIIGDFELSYLSLDDPSAVVRVVTVNGFDSVRDFPRLPFGNVRLRVERMNVRSVGEEVDMAFCMREAWL